MTTEQLRYRMYRDLADFKRKTTVNGAILPAFADLDSSLEAYLERLRREAVEQGMVLIDKCDELGSARIDAARMRQERDELQERLHAVDHAYSVQSIANAAAGDQLRKAMETIRKQRGFIRSLYTSRSKPKKASRLAE